MLRRLLLVATALSLLLPSAALAVDPAPEKYEPIINGPIDPQVLPLGLTDDRSVMVMLEMRGDPVAVVESRAPGKDLTQARRDAIKARLKARQDAIRGAIQARGGQVLSQLQSAYNGMRVQISRADAASLAELPNVVAVRGLQVHTIENAVGVPYIGTPGAWQDLGLTGEGIKVAIIDTGIDYTHANFGGPGTPEAFDAADATDTAPADPTLFGPDATTKVKGGMDFVGDDYNASSDDPAKTTPQPDPNPLDCNGHGSHVAGTAAGFGVLADGSTYGGPYDETTHDNDFRIGPGAAPEADLYALRVFGCAGSTDVTVEAIDWAVDNEMDVINMSLGSPFGRSTDPSAAASTNAAAAGVIVVASAGNSGASPYITGAPAAGDGAISVAAIDSTEKFPGFDLQLSTGVTITALNANAATLEDGTVFDVHVLRNPDGSVALGCNEEDYDPAEVTGKLVVTVRGTCARVARAVHGEKAGAAAVAMINTDAGYPPFEGPITSNPDTGEEFEVTIPFLGIRGVLGPANTADGDNLVAADGGTATATNTEIANPGFRRFAGFTSGGPRNGDSALKPDISAPGVSIQSTLVGSGNQGTRISGTSMAAPHVAGVGALMREAHPDWTVEEIKAAIVNTGDPDQIPGYRVSRGGSGLVQPAIAGATEVVALGDIVDGDEGTDVAEFQTTSLNFGFAELDADFNGTRTLTVKNHGTDPVTYSLGSAASPGSAPSTVSFSPTSITVDPGETATVDVTLDVQVGGVGNSMPTSANRHAFREVGGSVVLTSDGLPTLRVPYYLVPRPLSDVSATASGKLQLPGASITLENGGPATGFADFYAWQLEDGNDVNEAMLGGSGYDLRAVGLQSFDLGGGERLLVFAVNTHERWSNASVNEFDILIDSDDDGAPDFLVAGFDIGAILAGSFDGRYGSFTFDLSTGQLLAAFFASAPTDSSTVQLPALASTLGLSAGDGELSYSVQSFSLEGPGFDQIRGTAKLDAYDETTAAGQFEEVEPGAEVVVPVTVNPGLMKGMMVVVFDNASGQAEALLVPTDGGGGRRGRP